MLQVFRLPGGGILNVDNDVDADRCVRQGGVEIDSDLALAVFGDDWSCVSPSCARMAEDGTITYTPPDRSAEGLNWDDAGKVWIEDPSSPVLITARIADIDAELADVDARSARPLRAILTATQSGAAPAPADMEMLANLESRADELRSQRAALAGG